MTLQVKKSWYAPYLRREPASLALLTGMVVVFFTFVTGLSRIYYAQQSSLAERWSARGETDLAAHRFGNAVDELRAALLYSRDNAPYQLSLAEALIGLNRTSEAHAYLINLWSQQPENGRVNIDLARIAAQEGKTQQALRYYHNAIYANWPGDQEAQIRDARVELIEYLLRIKARAQAQSELISLQVFLGDDPSQQKQLGDLFMRTQDYEHALSAYRVALSAEPRDHDVLASAGAAAFDLGNYSLAVRYLQQAQALSPKDNKSRNQLKLAETVLRMDPFRPQISVAERNRAVVEDFAVAGDSLKACPVAASYVSSLNPQQDLAKDWTKLKPKVTLSGLRLNPDLVNTSMTTVFSIERQANIWCGTPNDSDSALLLIAKLHEGS